MTVGQSYSYAVGTYFFTPYVLLIIFSLLFFILCFQVLFHSYSSHAQLLRKTLVHEFHISYSHTEWYLLSSLRENGNEIWKQSAVKQIQN